MTTVNTTTGTTANTASTLSSTALSKTMDQADFLKLLTTQLQTQDPTNPVDNSQFVSQLAQFSQLASTQDLNTSVNNLGTQITGALQTSQVLSSTSLVGRQVLVPSDTAGYAGTAVAAAAGVVDAGDVKVSIKDSAGNLVRTLDLGVQQPGLAQFSWDGKDDQGNTVAAGSYAMSAASGDGNTLLSTYIAGTVSGVGYGGSSVGTYVQVKGVGGVPLDQIAQIN